MQSAAKRFLVIGLIVSFVSGCLFAPTKYGARGFAKPGSYQYDAYLANCCRMSPVLQVYCQQHGKPSIIEVGRSGGYFYWMSPKKLMAVRSFGNTEEYRSIPPKLERKFAAAIAGLNVRALENVKVRNAQTVAFEVDSLNYDEDTKKGVIRVLFQKGHYQDARSFARASIENMSRDKNVAIVTGEAPTAARYYLGDERVLDGNVLEMEFTTE